MTEFWPGQDKYYIPWYIQIIDLLIVNLILVPGALYTLTKINAKEPFPKKPLRPLYAIEKFATGLLCVGFAAQSVYKFLKSPVFMVNMLYPCHLISTLFLYCVYIRDSNYPLACKLFNVVARMGFYTFVAMVVPDTNDIEFLLQLEVFWIHHITLLILPMTLVWFRAFDYRVEWDYLHLAMYAMTIWCYNVQLPVGWLTDMNVNYMMYPPPKPGFVQGTPYYRYIIIPGLVLMTFLTDRLIAFSLGMEKAAFHNVGKPAPQEQEPGKLDLHIHDQNGKLSGGSSTTSPARKVSPKTPTINGRTVNATDTASPGIITRTRSHSRAKRD
eukprot:Clim_evm74s25 gene=Clim_evmTU74s25